MSFRIFCSKILFFRLCLQVWTTWEATAVAVVTTWWWIGHSITTMVGVAILWWGLNGRPTWRLVLTGWMLGGSSKWPLCNNSSNKPNNSSSKSNNNSSKLNNLNRPNKWPVFSSSSSSNNSKLPPTTPTTFECSSKRICNSKRTCTLVIRVRTCSNNSRYS